MRPDTSTGPAHAVDRRMALAREWDELVGRARRLDGFADFLRPPPVASLLPVAAHGPVAMVNVSRWRCDALTVTSRGIGVIPLPRLSSELVVERTAGYLGGLRAVDRAQYELYVARQRFEGGDRSPEAFRRYTDASRALYRAVADRESMLAELLGWLWDDIAEPVLTGLGIGGDDDPLPRLWWCPTGLLSLLPLHAAGHHDEPGRSVLERVVPSYTPTLRALLAARGRRPEEDDRMLVVAVPDPPDAVPLTDVNRERDLLTSLFPDRHTLLDGPAATVDAVRAALPRHGWAHFSCHGGQNLVDPSRGGLLLHDGHLDIGAISAGEHLGEFAFLSACMTATGGIDLPDEVITLAAALHYTGYRQVVGTLWAVYDVTAADVATSVYTDLTGTGRFRPAGAARALHRAVRGLRDSGLPPSAWTPFTHTGP